MPKKRYKPGSRIKTPPYTDTILGDYYPLDRPITVPLLNPHPYGKVWLGIDPGKSGGLCVIVSENAEPNSPFKIAACNMPNTECELHDWIVTNTYRDILWMQPFAQNIRTVIEAQLPRPTRWRDKSTGQQQSSVLASTCTLYGQYMQLRMLLIGRGIAFEDCPPQRWQKWYNDQPPTLAPSLYGPGDDPQISEWVNPVHIPSRDKESDSEWKRVLRDAASKIYPNLTITLSTADAILLAHYCKANYP